MLTGNSQGILSQLAKLMRKLQLAYKVPPEQAQYLAIGHALLTGSFELSELPRLEELLDAIKKEFDETSQSLYERFLELYWQEISKELTEDEKLLLSKLNPEQESYTLEKILKLLFTDNIAFVNNLLSSLEAKGLIQKESRVWHQDLNVRIKLLPLAKWIIKKIKQEQE